MKKQIKIILGFVLVIAVLFLSFYLATKDTSTNKNNQEADNQIELGQEEEGVDLNQVMTEKEKEALNISSESEYEVISRDENGEVNTYKIVSSVEKTNVKLEFMNKKDIQDKSLYEEGRYQVLERDEEGNVTAYKVIYSDDDIVREYANYIYSY